MLDSGANIERQIEFYQRKYELNPHSRAFAPLADLYRKAGRLEEALEVLEAGLAEHPRYVSALVILARCHTDAQRSVEAGLAFTRVLDLDPDNLVALKNLAEMALTGGDETRGAELLERVVYLDPTDETAAVRLEALRRGTAIALPVPEPEIEIVATSPSAPPPDEAPEAGIGAAPETAPETAPVAVPEAVPVPESGPAPVPERQSFATRTLADIYLAQGYRDKALTVLREILTRHPERTDVAAKITEIESQAIVLAEPTAGSGAAAAAVGARSPTDSRRHFETWLDRLGKPEEQA